ncbi:MAG: glutathione S-transferase family protein [Micropepsaceae bacterium]
MELELYHGLASTCSKKVRLCLYEKGLPFASHLLNLQKFEQHLPDYLALNPKGVVPTLVHRGKPVTESSHIIEYLDENFPQVPLRPRAPEARAQIREWLNFSDTVAYDAVYVPTWTILSAGAMRGLSDAERDALLSRVPTLERRKRWEQVTSSGFDRTEIEAAHTKMHECLERCEAVLDEGPWLAGDNYSLADIAVVPFVDRIGNLKPKFLAAPLFPKLNEWLTRMRARPAFAKAFEFSDDPRAATLVNI